jgi:hypothetical protein
VLETAWVAWARVSSIERRRRTLAGDDRAGSWARARARTTQREFLREHWLLFGSAVGGSWLVAAVCGLAMPNAFMQGLVVGAALVAAPVSVWVLAVQITGSAPIMMGDQAEQWTAQELRPLHRRGWLLINHFSLGVNDIDHVLLGPGGAFVVETKWSGSTWESGLGTQRQRDAARQADLRARSLRLWHPFKSRGIPVTPLVVLWGRGLSSWSAPHQIRQIDSVTVLAGPALREWTEQLGVGVLSPSEIEHAWQGARRAGEPSRSLGRGDISHTHLVG